MTDHLPECPYTGKHPHYVCICAALRACEQRVRESERARNSGSAMRIGAYQDGYAKGLDAAREAVAALDPLCSGLCECLPDALAAIDALRDARD